MAIWEEVKRRGLPYAKEEDDPLGKLLDERKKETATSSDLSDQGDDPLSNILKQRKQQSANEWLKSSAGLVEEISAKGGNWFDRGNYEDWSNRATVLLNQGSRFRNQYLDNAEATSQIDNVLAAIKESRSIVGQNYNNVFSRFSKKEDYDSAVRQYGYLTKYSGKSASELTAALDGLAPGEERDWLALYAQESKNNELYNFDLSAGQTEIDDLKAQLAAKKQELETHMVAYGKMHGYDEGMAKKHFQIEDEIKALEEQIATKSRFLGQAKEFQQTAALSTVNNPDAYFFDPDFAMHSQYQSGTGDVIYDLINRKLSREDAESVLTWAPYEADPLDLIPGDRYTMTYQFMTDEEIALYNYWYAKGGKDTAKKYLTSIQNELTRRKAARVYENKYDDSSYMSKLWLALSSGAMSWAEGSSNFFNFSDDKIPTSVFQELSAMAREDLADEGAKLPGWLGGATVGQAVYDTVSSIGNMAPSLIMSTAVGVVDPAIGKVAGAAMTGVGAAGNAYQEALNQGYDKTTARIYSTILGASEGGLEYLLSGISKLGGKFSGKAVEVATKGVKKAALRIAMQFVGKIASEALEEGLQEVVDVTLRNVVLGESNEYKIGDILYSALLGGVTALFFGGPDVVSETKSNIATGREIKNAGITADQLASLGKLQPADSAAYKLAGKVDEKTGAYTLGRMFRDIGAEITEQNKADIKAQLMDRGVLEKDATILAEAFADAVMGAPMTEQQIEVLENCDVLTEEIFDALFSEDSAYSKRSNDYAMMVGAVSSRSKYTPINATETASARAASTPAAADIMTGETTPAMVESAAKAAPAAREVAETPTDADVIKAYRAYYDAGYSNTPMEKVAVSSTALTEEQKAAAWEDGQKVRNSFEKGKTTSFVKQGETGAVVENPAALDFGKHNGKILKSLKQFAKNWGVKIVIGNYGDHINGSIKDGVIRLNAEKFTGKTKTQVLAKILAHEITHRMQETAPEAYAKYRDAALQNEADLVGGSLDGVIRGYQNRQVTAREKAVADARAKNKDITPEEIAAIEADYPDLSREGAMDEIAADYTKKFIEDTEAFREFIGKSKEHRSLGRKLIDCAKAIVAKIKATFSSQKARDAASQEAFGKDLAPVEKALKLWEEAYAEGQKAVKNAPLQESTGDVMRKNSIEPNYATDVHNWQKAGMPFGEVFTLGSTGDVLQGLGAIESDIFIEGDKISTIMTEHPEMTIHEIAQIPQILDDPVLILISKNVAKAKNNSRLVIFGSIKAQNRKPIMCILELRPVENGLVLADMQKVASAYTKETSPSSFLNSSYAMYADKKRTPALLSAIGFTMPGGLQRSGYIGSITYPHGIVKMQGIKFSDLFVSNSGKNRASLSGDDILAEAEERAAAEREVFDQFDAIREGMAKGKVVMPSSVEKLANDVIRSWGADMDSEDIMHPLQTALDAAIRAKGVDKIYNAYDELVAIGRTIAENIVEVEGDIFMEYSQLRKELRDYHIYVGPEIVADIADYFDTVRPYRNRLKLTTKKADGAVTIDQAFHDLQAAYPWLFNEDNISTPADQLLKLLEVTDSLYERGAERYLEAHDVETAAREIAIDLLNRAGNIKPRYKDEAAARRQRVKERLDKLRQQKDEKIKELEQAARDARLGERMAQQRKSAEQVRKLKEAAESKRRTAMREKIMKFKQKLESDLLHPTDSSYIPPSMAKAMIELCDLINDDRALYKKDGSLNASQAQKEATKAKLQALKDAYEELSAEKDDALATSYDRDIYEYLKWFNKEYGNRNIAEMSLADLKHLYDVLKSIRGTLMDAKRMIGEEEARAIYEVADGIRAEQDTISKERRKGKAADTARTAQNALTYESLSPMRIAERMSGYNPNSPFYKLFRAFETGVRKANRFSMNAHKMFSELVSGKSADVYEDAVHKEIGKIYTDTYGRKFRVTKMQMMQAVLSWEREVANDMNHMQSGGMTFADTKLLNKGKVADAISADKAHRVRNAVDMITDFQAELKNDAWAQDYMKTAREFFNSVAKDAINETTLVLNHRMVATGKAYIPFDVDKNTIVREISAANDIQQTISGYGMLKSLVDKAPQPIIISGLNNSIERHIDQVSNIYGLAIPIRNFNKVWNSKTNSMETNDPDMVKAVIQRNWGVKGVKAIEQTVQDLQGHRPDKEGSVYRWIKSNYITSTFLLNLSVVTKQIGSMYTAGAMLSKRYSTPRLLGNLLWTMANYKKIAAEVDKYSAASWVRRQGMSDADVATLYTQAKKSKLRPVTNWIPDGLKVKNWITAMDSTVALSMWKYAKLDVAKRTGLAGEALNEATVEFYEDLVEHTQSMADVLHRPEIQKSQGIVSDALGLFKTDLYQMAGQLESTIGRYMYSKTKENKKAVINTAVSIVRSALWSQAMTVIFAALRYKPDRYRDEEGEVTAWSVLERSAYGLFADLAGYVFPLAGTEIVGLFEEINYGENYDVADNIVLSAINDAKSVVVMIGGKMKDGEPLSWYETKKIVTTLLPLLRVPAKNIDRFYNALTLHYKDIKNGEFLSFNAGKGSEKHRDLYDAIKGGRTSYVNSLKKGYKDEASYNTAVRKALRENDKRIYAAALARNNGDTEEYVRLAKEIIADGFSEENVKEAIKSEQAAINKGNPSYKLESWDNPNEAFSEASDYYDAILTGDTSLIEDIHDELVYEQEGIGYLELDAEQNVANSLISQVKTEYLNGNISSGKAVKIMQDYGNRTEGAAKLEIRKLDFQLKYGVSWSSKDRAYYTGRLSREELVSGLMKVEEKSESVAQRYVDFLDVAYENQNIDIQFDSIEGYYEYAQGAGISEKTYLAYLEKKGSMSKQADVWPIIDALPISDAQKDALHLAEGWSENSLKNTPWHK